jgi:hypothetical protein
MSNEQFGFFQQRNPNNNENFYEAMNKDWRTLPPEIMPRLSIELARALLEENKSLLIKTLNNFVAPEKNNLAEITRRIRSLKTEELELGNGYKKKTL